MYMFSTPIIHTDMKSNQHRVIASRLALYGSLWPGPASYGRTWNEHSLTVMQNTSVVTNLQAVLHTCNHHDQELVAMLL